MDTLILPQQDKQFLLKLAVDSIDYGLKNRQIMPFNKVTVLSKRLENEYGTFVTLNIDKKLRGCIGNILPEGPIWQSVIRNAYMAAFKDPRFPPLTRKEFFNLDVEISILSIPTKLEIKDRYELLDYLAKNKPGVIIEFGGLSATYLPQVWEQIPNPQEFLSYLCQKAGLDSDTWINLPVNIYTYSVYAFKDSVANILSKKVNRGS